MKKIILITCFLAVNVLSFAGSVTGEPTIDFGSVAYVPGSSSGFRTITVSAAGATTTSSSGALTGTPAGTSGSASIGSFSWAESTTGTITFQTNKSTSATTISTSGCGSVSINNFTTTGGATSTTASASSSSTVSFPVGATLTLQSFTGTSGCTISGKVSGPVQFRIKGLIITQTDWTNVPVNITIYIAPRMSFSHTANAKLDFGTICSDDRTQTVTVALDGSHTATNVHCTNPGTSADSFTVTGMANQTFAISLPASVAITNSRGDSLTVSNLNASCTQNCSVDSGGTSTISVGGMLTVPARTPGGEYTGNYTVSLTY